MIAIIFFAFLMDKSGDVIDLRDLKVTDDEGNVLERISFEIGKTGKIYYFSASKSQKKLKNLLHSP